MASCQERHAVCVTVVDLGMESVELVGHSSIEGAIIAEAQLAEDLRHGTRSGCR